MVCQNIRCSHSFSLCELAYLETVVEREEIRGRERHRNVRTRVMDGTAVVEICPEADGFEICIWGVLAVEAVD